MLVLIDLHLQGSVLGNDGGEAWRAWCLLNIFTIVKGKQETTKDAKVHEGKRIPATVAHRNLSVKRACL